MDLMDAFQDVFLPSGESPHLFVRMQCQAVLTSCNNSYGLKGVGK